MARFVLGLGLFLVLAGILVASYVGLNGEKGMATQAQTAIALVLVSGPGAVLSLVGGLWVTRQRK